MPPEAWLDKMRLNQDVVIDGLDTLERDLARWKVRRETRRLYLAGTIWETRSAFTGRLAFGRDGRIRILPPRGWSVSVEIDGKFRYPADPEGQSILAPFDGMVYRNLPVTGWEGDCMPMEPNLYVEGADWEIRYQYDGNTLQLHFLTRSPSSGYSQERSISLTKIKDSEVSMR